MKYEIKISPGNTKLGKIPSISLDPHLVCNRDWPCYAKCYAKNIARLRPTVRAAWQNNVACYIHDKAGYEKQIYNYLASKSPKYFRWHVGGEVIDQNYVGMILRLARAFKTTSFLLYTRKPGVKWPRKLPANLNMFRSMWLPGDGPMPDGDLQSRRAFVTEKDSIMNKTIEDIPVKPHKCPGNCVSCMFCFDDKTERGVHFTVHR